MRRSMPTAAKMVAALCLGFGAMIMVPVLLYYYPEEPWQNDAGAMYWLFGLVGLGVGWYSLGKKIDEEAGVGIYLGLRAGITVMAWCIFLMALNGLWQEILSERLQGAEPVEAFFDLTNRIGDYLVFAAHSQILLIWAGITITVGLLTKGASKAWG